MDTDRGTAGVAKKKPKGHPKVKAPSVDRKPMIAQLRGAEEWKAWIERGAAFDTRTVAGLIERAVVVYLKQIGFTEEPPER